MDAKYQRFVVFLPRRPDKVADEAAVRAHVAHMRELDALGHLELAGPFADRRGGMLILRAASLEQAQELASRDPFVTGGYTDLEVRAWWLSCEENNHLGMG